MGNKVRINDYGQMVLTDEQAKLVRAKLNENPCPACHAKAGEDCKGTKHCHMGRVPQNWDAVAYLEAL